MTLRVWAPTVGRPSGLSLRVDSTDRLDSKTCYERPLSLTNGWAAAQEKQCGQGSSEEQQGSSQAQEGRAAEAKRVAAVIEGFRHEVAAGPPTRSMPKLAENYA
jgi:hypothetical protein